MYITIANTIYVTLTTIMSLMLCHFVIFSIIGIFVRKTYQKTEIKHNYGIIIPTRNEEKVVGNLIRSIRKTKYPQDKLHIFVIAHNCTDKTAEICREIAKEYGEDKISVYEYSNPQECTKGYAMKYLLDCINRDFDALSFDGFFLLDADNVLDVDYFDKMNDAFHAGNCQNVVTSFRNSKNFGSNVMSALYGIYFMSGCRFESRGRTLLGCSTRVQGTGYVFNSEVVKNGWEYVTLTEDWEFTADQILRGRQISYCDEAVFYDEQPTSMKVMLRQRLRWSKGHLLVCLTKGKQLFKKIFARKKDGEKIHRFSLYDIFINIMPICVVAVALFLLQFITMAIAPLFGYTLAESWLVYGKGLLITLSLSYATMVVQATLVLILEHKRIKGCSIFTKIGAILLWPLFIGIALILEIIAVFKDVGWKPIPHEDTTDFEKLNEVENIECVKSELVNVELNKERVMIENSKENNENLADGIQEITTNLEFETQE